MEIFGYVLIKKKELIEKEKLLVKANLKIKKFQETLNQLDKPKKVKSKHIKRQITLKNIKNNGIVTSYSTTVKPSKIVAPDKSPAWLHNTIIAQEKKQNKTDVSFWVNGYEVHSVQVGGQENASNN